jgi:hypothetical protein
MTYPEGDKVAVDASEVTIKPADLGEIRAALKGGEYLVLLAITADDRVVAYHSSSFVPEQTEADVSRSSAPRAGDGRHQVQLLPDIYAVLPSP